MKFLFFCYLMTVEATRNDQDQRTDCTRSEKVKLDQYRYDQIATASNHQNRHPQNGFDDH